MKYEKIIAKHQACWGNAAFMKSSLLATLFFLIALVVNDRAGDFATARMSNHVSDFLLDELPVVDVTRLIVAGSIFLAASVPILMILEPSRIPFTGYTMGLFIFIRAAFVCLTHTAAPSGSLGYDSPFFRAIGLAYNGDLFFSGHTGGPFLLSLIFKEQIRLRITFVSVSVVLGALMLLARAHYSIDVFAAFFISYSIFHLSMWFFPGARRVFHEGPAPRVKPNSKTDA